MSGNHRYHHVGPEQKVVLGLIDRGFNNLRKLKARAGLPERRLQRRVNELLEQDWITQVGLYTEPSVSLRIFELTDAGRRNVPSGP